MSHAVTPRDPSDTHVVVGRGVDGSVGIISFHPSLQSAVAAAHYVMSHGGEARVCGLDPLGKIPRALQREIDLMIHEELKRITQGAYMRPETAEEFLKRLGLTWPPGGFYCGPGWMPLVEKLVGILRGYGWDEDLHQVKQKFGGLRFYIGVGSKEIHDTIHTAEHASFTLCEHCGAEGGLRNLNGYRTTLCDSCYSKSNR